MISRPLFGTWNRDMCLIWRSFGHRRYGQGSDPIAILLLYLFILGFKGQSRLQRERRDLGVWGAATPGGQLHPGGGRLHQAPGRVQCLAFFDSLKYGNEIFSFYLEA